MTIVITRTGKGSEISQAENDANLSSLCGINESQTGTTYTVVAADQNRTIEFSNASSVAVTLTAIATILSGIDTDDFKVTLKNIGAGTVTVTRGGTDTFDGGGTSITLGTGDCVTIQSDSTQAIWNIISEYIEDAATKSGTETLTNKTLTSPVLNSATINGGTMIAGTAVDLTAYGSGTVTFGSIPSWAKKITLIFSGVSCASAGNLGIRIGDSGGIETTNYTYLQHAHAITPSISGTYTTGATYFLMGNTSAAGNVALGTATISNIDGNEWIMCSSMGNSGHYRYHSDGTKTLSGALTQIQFYSNSNFDLGTVNILYEG